ncbi:MAG: polysaccharide pyruvyl transferase family protein [Brachybacterium sp.]|uniref:polysaccharide pyruvyl transferase family protein n=1 Tax=Brachybacterium sp. TaxID=1891286 RepID=UPI0026494B21|nr:polysaccharide pyruvyl transferase family protein [Brachybacterium sp.]MDN5686368.1 polysaccharide pyruvyl transferase family protein [Brachybacterium sp.]
MGKVAIVGTYRDRGTRNIGDGLIGRSVAAMIADSHKSVQARQVFRAADWEEARPTIEWADHIIFACLAIRRNLATKTYPYIREVLDSGKPYSILAAGTDMPVKANEDFGDSIDAESVEILREVGRGATCFTTRGVLSQYYCELVGVPNSVYGGDVAFYYPEAYGRDFFLATDIADIVISDPHRADRYLSSMDVLINGLRNMFPAARIRVALHGVNDEIEEYCATNSIEAVRIYEDVDSGLSIYDSCDLHVGYRVHGHVSALARRAYSYLLEQDGRGADYGLTLTRKVSVPHFLQPYTDGTNGRTLKGSIAAPQQLLGLIAHDLADGFSRFVGFGRELEGISRTNEEYVAQIVRSLK